MTRHRFLALCLELISLVSFQKQLFEYVNHQDILPEEAHVLVPNEEIFLETAFCLEKRGQHGKWLPPETGSSQKSGLVGFDDPLKSDPAVHIRDRPSQLWQWQEDSDCRIHKMQRRMWCKLMKNLRISRIYTTGDSIMKDVTRMLRSELFQPEVLTASSIEEPIELQCGQKRNRTIIQHIPWHLEREPPFLVDSHYGRNLVILTIGSQLTSLEAFQRNLHELLSWADEWRQPSDIVIYISTVSRSTCSVKINQRKTTSTVANHSGHKEFSSKDSSLIESYNLYAKNLLAEQHILYLDVVNSTALWRDRFRVDHITNTCDPDPLDWWIHFLYSALLDMGTSSDKLLQRII